MAQPSTSAAMAANMREINCGPIIGSRLAFGEITQDEGAFMAGTAR